MLVTAAAVAVATLGFSTSASAFSFFNQPFAGRSYYEPARPPAWRPPVRSHRPKNTGATAKQKPADKAAPSDNPEALAPKANGVLAAIISIDRQQLTLYSDGRPVATSRVSTGTASHPTPTGVFSVIQKNRWHRSNIYDNAPMFYMQRITWSGVAMHQGIVPNQPASHGCIRLPEAFARQLWGITKLGTRVIVARGQVAPVEIAHASLFKLRREPLEAVPQADASSPDRVKAAYGALDIVRRTSAAPSDTASDLSKAKDPALDAMALAMTPPRTAPTTSSSSDVVKSTYDAFEMRRSKTTGGNSHVAEVQPLRPGPVSVFISRKEGKLFVRKGFEPLFDVPVTFTRPEQPLGTHVYTALAFKDDQTSFRWNVVTLASGARKAEKGKPMEWSGPSSTASQALDRVSIPQEAIDRISELMSPGASLIISDQGLGPETGKGTDFIVLTR